MGGHCWWLSSLWLWPLTEGQESFELRLTEGQPIEKVFLGEAWLPNLNTNHPRPPRPAAPEQPPPLTQRQAVQTRACGY